MCFSLVFFPRFISVILSGNYSCGMKHSTKAGIPSLIGRAGSYLPLITSSCFDSKSSLKNLKLEEMEWHKWNLQFQKYCTWMEKKNKYLKDLEKLNWLHTDITTGPMIHPVCDGWITKLGVCDPDLNCQALDFSGIIQLNHLCFLHSLIILSLRLSWRTDLDVL